MTCKLVIVAGLSALHECRELLSVSIAASLTAVRSFMTLHMLRVSIFFWREAGFLGDQDHVLEVVDDIQQFSFVESMFAVRVFF